MRKDSIMLGFEFVDLTRSQVNTRKEEPTLWHRAEDIE